MHPDDNRTAPHRWSQGPHSPRHNTFHPGAHVVIVIKQKGTPFGEQSALLQHHYSALILLSMLTVKEPTEEFLHRSTDWKTSEEDKRETLPLGEPHAHPSLARVSCGNKGTAPPQKASWRRNKSQYSHRNRCVHEQPQDSTCFSSWKAAFPHADVPTVCHRLRS